MIRLRPVNAADEPFLSRLYASTRTEELAPVPWSEEQKRAFLEMQFQAQTAHYTKHYRGGDFLVIENDAEPIGRLYIYRQPADIRIVDIALLPAHRGAGIGTRLLRDILSEGKSTGRSVSIHVEDFNPAMRLYERLGFRHIDTHGVYHLMEWRAGDQVKTASYS
jgi:ribosomal protein S18 acetylase RimI-like enzyme